MLALQRKTALLCGGPMLQDSAACLAGGRTAMDRTRMALAYESSLLGCMSNFLFDKPRALTCRRGKGGERNQGFCQI